MVKINTIKDFIISILKKTSMHFLLYTKWDVIVFSGSAFTWSVHYWYWPKSCIKAIKLWDFKVDVIKWQLNLMSLVWNHSLDFKPNSFDFEIKRRSRIYCPDILWDQAIDLIWLWYHAHLAKFGYGKYLIVPFWYASAASQARLFSPWVFWLAKYETWLD